MKKITYIVLLVLIVLLVGVMVKFKYMVEEKTTVSISGQEFHVEMVSAKTQLEKGLGGRDSLCDDCGMLFIFPQSGSYSFWMKDMRFNLDIIWIENGKITFIARNVSFDSKETINPRVPADRVLEINAGLSDKYGFKVGDNVEISQ